MKDGIPMVDAFQGLMDISEHTFIKEDILQKQEICISHQNDQLLFCITLYNEHASSLLLSLFAVAQAISYYHKHQANASKVSVCILADGHDKMAPSTIYMLESLGLLNNKQEDEKINLYDNKASINEISKAFFQYVNDIQHNHLIKSWLSDNCENIEINSSIEFRVVLCIKNKNAGKLDSHWW